MEPGLFQAETSEINPGDGPAGTGGMGLDGMRIILLIGFGHDGRAINTPCPDPGDRVLSAVWVTKAMRLGGDAR